MAGGEIGIEEENVEITRPGQAQELGIGIIYQEFILNAHLTVADNIFLGREPVVWPGVINQKNLNRDAREILNSLNVSIDPGQLAGTLGVAMQQMVEVARALSLNAKILIMDEPTAALASKEIEALFTTIQI